MAINYGYYLPLSEALYQEIRFLDISPKTEGVGEAAKQQTDKDGVPKWVLTALVKFQGSKQETETFTLTAPQELAEKINAIPELTNISLKDLAGGKWSKTGVDKTSWSFQITGVEVVK